jgi:DNA-binding GntR family transcriptional regulator
VHRRTPSATSPGRHSPYRSSPPAAALGHLLHTFELAIVLETHAASRAAARLDRDRDLRHVHAALDQLSCPAMPPRPVTWVALEIQFHRALNDQGGNLVLSSLAERTLRDGLSACPIPSGEVLSILQSHHREILRRVEANAADAAAHHTRAHMLWLRDVLVDAARGATPTRVRLHP